MSFNPYEFDRSMNPQGQLESISQYTTKVFLWMVLGLLVTFGVAVAGWVTNATLWILYYMPYIPWVLVVVTLILSVTMAARIERMSVNSARAMFLAFSALFGFTMSQYFYLYHLGSVLTAFLAAALYFGVLAAYGYFTHTDLSRMGSFLFGSLLFLVVYGFATWIFGVFSGIDWIISLFAIAVFLGYTAYDTQKIRYYYNFYCGYPDMLEKAAIFSALQLYLDFVNLFVRLLQLLGNRKRN